MVAEPAAKDDGESSISSLNFPSTPVGYLFDGPGKDHMQGGDVSTPQGGGRVGGLGRRRQMMIMKMTAAELATKARMNMAEAATSLQMQLR